MKSARRRHRLGHCDAGRERKGFGREGTAGQGHAQRLHRLPDALRNRFGVFFRDVAAEERKFLAADACDEVALLDRLAKQRRKLAERLFCGDRAAVLLGDTAQPLD